MRPTIGSTISRSPPTIDSTKSWPLFGTKVVLPTRMRTTKLIKSEITQLVIIELVMGSPKTSKAFSAVKLTPSFPAAERFNVVNNRKRR